MKTHTMGCPALLLADDNPVLLATLVEMLEPEYRILASLSNGVSVLDRIDLLRPDILLLDVALGDLSGFDVARCLRDRHSPAKILFLSVHEDIEFVTAAFDIGAFGYVFKSRAAEDLREAIAIVWTGGRFVSPTDTVLRELTVSTIAESLPLSRLCSRTSRY